ncbi:hypothetical protein GCM10009862_25860 [Microbacterium binotii]|uniref:Uncharacterized protein n=1 Tax=Microbacterium binotii TaxID=462710 RepID=A0ABN3PH63_9MICO
MRALIVCYVASVAAPDPSDPAAERDSRTSPDSSGATAALDEAIARIGAPSAGEE